MKNGTVPSPVKEGLLSIEQWQGLTDLQRKHFRRTYERAQKAGLDYWEYIQLSKGDRISKRLEGRGPDVWTKDKITIIQDGYERKIATRKLAEILDCKPDTVRSVANANGIYRKTYRIKFTRVEVRLPEQDIESILAEMKGKTNQFYVYSYVRTDGTPYYIGKGKNRRAFQAHRRPAPKGGIANYTPRDPNRIRFLKWNMSEDDAFQMEKDLIAEYGTIELGTGCLLNFTSGGDGLRDPSPSARRRISAAAKKRGMPSNLHERRRETSYKRTCKKYNIPLEVYKGMSSDEQIACLGWLRYNKDKNVGYEDYLARNETDDNQRRLFSRQANLKVLQDNADKFEMPLDMWADLTTKEKAALRYFCNAHPEVSGVDYLNGNYRKFQSTKDGLEHQKMAGAKAAILKQKEAAKKYGMSYEDYSELSLKQKNALKTWVKRHSGKNGYDYLEFKSA